MRKLSLLLPGFIAVLLFTPGLPEKKMRILVFSKTTGFRHASIADGKKALLQLAAAEGFAADTTEEAAVFTDKQLRCYAVVVFLNTTGDVLDSGQQAAFQRFIRSGRGFAGIHSATDTEYEWPWFNGLVGAQFSDHPKPQEAVLIRQDSVHLSTRFLPASWKRFDEWYNFKHLYPAIRPLLLLDEQTYSGGKQGAVHPVAWYHTYDGGRSFYTALGHTPESYREPLFLAHILGGIRYAAGLQ